MAVAFLQPTLRDELVSCSNFMKKRKDYTLLALAIPFLIAVAAAGGFSCKSKEMPPAQPECPYEGLECPNAQLFRRDYQIAIDHDSLYLYDLDRKVGAVTWANIALLDGIMLHDNE